MTRAAITAAAAAIAIAAIQFVPVARHNFRGSGDLPAPPTVKIALRTGCYDCHSNQTRLPWYGAVAPASWLVAHEVNQGRQRLNFSDWDAYASDPETAARKLDEIADLVIGGEMAPWFYVMMHPGARLSREQRQIIAEWARDEARRVTH